jgi:uncharacterized damage-inducible protein DinB
VKTTDCAAQGSPVSDAAKTSGRSLDGSGFYPATIVAKNIVMNQTFNFTQMWEEGRTRFFNLLSKTREDDLVKKLSPSPNSAGFLIRHIAEVELLFAKNVFKAEAVEVHAKTLIAQKDTGEWTSLKELIEYQQLAFDHLKSIIQRQSDEDWQQSVTTKEFGTKTKAEALGRIVSHTAYHAGQLAIILKYGK